MSYFKDLTQPDKTLGYTHGHHSRFSGEGEVLMVRGGGGGLGFGGFWAGGVEI